MEDYLEGLILTMLYYMLQEFRTYKEHQNPSYDEEVMVRRSFVAKPA